MKNFSYTVLPVFMPIPTKFRLSPELESQLNPNDFFRVNRQYIVSASAVSGLKFSIAQLDCNVKCRLAIQSILN